MLRLAARGIRARGRPAPADVAAPRHRTARERAGLRADPARLAAYLRATAGDRVAAFTGQGAVLPPFFPATWELGLGLEMLSTLEHPLPLGAVVHAASEVTWARPIGVDDAVRCRVELDRVEQTKRGLKLTVLARSWTGAGQLCTESTGTLLIRTGASGENGKRERRAEPPPSGEWREVERWHLSAAAGRRYARASGDYNPIHLWPLTARAFGFRAPILHGYAIAARAAHGIVA
ncbi:MAG TPA: MaoC/PaaZ C-terminal domain-containing protein, partial [Longimicrobium sp.]|nr:MaoC/PaaZ C-terminal domain-containing protein [Longimicrobium sp.]